MNELALKLDVLEALASVGAVGMTNRTLVNQVQLTSRPCPSFTEIESAVKGLEAARHVVSVRDELDGKTVSYSITGSGLAQLRAHGR